MTKLKDFAEFVNLGIIKKQSSNKPRAKFLVNESKKNYSFLLESLSKIKMTNDNANSFIKLCYDILMESVRAKMLLDGYQASGFGAHEAEVSYLKILGFNEKDVQFADQMRFFRNGMLYYGTILDKVYAEKVISFTKEKYSELIKLIIKS